MKTLTLTNSRANQAVLDALWTASDDGCTGSENITLRAFQTGDYETYTAKTSREKRALRIAIDAGIAQLAAEGSAGAEQALRIAKAAWIQ